MILLTLLNQKKIFPHQLHIVKQLNLSMCLHVPERVYLR